MSVKVGLLGRSSTVSISKSGKLEGLLGRKFMKEEFFPTNCSFFNASNLNETFADGLVSQVDFIKDLPLPTELRSDLTTGPPYSELSCFLISDKTTRTHHEMRQFLTSFGSNVIENGIIVAMMTFLLITLLRFQSNVSFCELFWRYLTLSSRGYSKSASRRGHVSLSVPVLFWLVLIRIIYICCIRMELVASERGQNIETFDDVVEGKMLITPWYSGHCFEAWKNIAKHSPPFNKSFEVIHKTQFKRNTSWYKTGLLDKVIIGEDSVMFSAATSRCAGSAAPVKTFYRSKSPMFTQILSQTYYRHLDREKRKILTTWAYAALEMGFDRNKVRLIMKMNENFFNEPFKPSCLQDDSQTISSPQLRIYFFIDCFELFYVLAVISSVVFLAELNHISAFS